MAKRRDILKYGLIGLAGITGLSSMLRFYETKHILNIVTYPSPVLRQVSRFVERIDDAVVSLARSMITTLRYRAFFEFFSSASLYKGLSAPQVGVSQRLIVCGLQGRVLAMVNPVILDRRGTHANSEYCMSLPRHDRRVVRRSSHIKLTYRDLDNREKTLNVRGSAAGLVQHEIDHLDGRLYID